MPQSIHHFALNSTTGRWTLISCILASSMVFIDTTAFNVVLPALQQDLSANGTDLFWVLNSYLLMLSALTIVGGSLGDLLGRVLVFKWGIVVFIVASVLCSFSQSINQLISFRVMQGFGGALMIPGSLSILSATFSDQEKGKAIGSWSAATTLVTMGGPVLGGALADAGLWRLIFFINLPIGLTSLAVLHLKVPESKASIGKQRVDWLGAGALVVSLAAFTFGLLNAPQVGIKSLASFGPIVLGVLFFVGFIFIEKKVSLPMVPLQIFKDPCFAGVNGLSFFLYASLSAVMLFLALNLIQVQGYSQLQAGMAFLPFPIVMSLLARHMGGLSDAWGSRRFLIVGPTLTGIGFLLLAWVGQTSGPPSFWLTYLPGIMVFSLGMATTVVPLTTTVMRALPNRQAGIASGVNNSVTRMASTFINAIFGALSVYLFIQLVEGQLDSLNLSSTVNEHVVSEAINFGEARPPKQVPDNKRILVEEVYRKSFITTYQLVTYAAAGLAFLSALFAVFTIKDFKDKEGQFGNAKI